MGPMMKGRTRLASLFVMLIALLLGSVVFVPPAYACSCAVPEPRDALAEADAAFVGVVTRTGGFIEGLTGGWTYRFDVEHDLKEDGRIYIENDGIVRCLPSSGPACDVDDVTVPANSSNFRWSPDRAYLAGLRYAGDTGPDAANEVILVDGATGEVHAFELGGWNDFGDVSWVGEHTIAYLPGGGDDETGYLIEVPGMVGDDLVDGWYTGESHVVDGRAIGIGWGKLMWLDLDSGRLRSVDLAGDTWAVAAVGGSIEADPQPVGEPILSSEEHPGDVVPRTDRSPGPWIVAGIMAIGLVVLILALARRVRRSAA